MIKVNLLDSVTDRAKGVAAVEQKVANPQMQTLLFALVVFGLLLSLPLVVWGSGLLARLMNRFPLIIWIGGGVLGWVAMKMMLDDPIVIDWLGHALAQTLHQIAPYALGALIAALGWWFARGAKRPDEAG